MIGAPVSGPAGLKIEANIKFARCYSRSETTGMYSPMYSRRHHAPVARRSAGLVKR